MPDYSLVRGAGSCTTCGTEVLRAVRIQWGTVPNETYEVGEEPRWLRDSSGAVVPSFELVKAEPGQWRWNGGDVTIANAVLLDVLFDSDVALQGLKCPSCGASIGAGAVVLRNGIFESIRVLTDDEVESMLGGAVGKADIVVVRGDETYWPREDWYDHPLRVRA